MTLDRRSQIPLYAQLMKELKNKIQDGQYGPGSQIPTETELSQMYNVSRITVRRTIEELCSQGVLVKRQGKGTFVEEPRIFRQIEQVNNMSFSEACRANGRKPSSHILSCRLTEADEMQSQFLQLKSDKMLYHIERVLSADDLPIIYEQIYILASRVPELQIQKLEDGSFFRLLRDEYHILSSGNGRSIVEARIASQAVAGYLRMNAGEPVLDVKSYMNDSDENPLYISHEIIAGSRYSLSI